MRIRILERKILLKGPNSYINMHLGINRSAEGTTVITPKSCPEYVAVLLILRYSNIDFQTLTRRGWCPKKRYYVEIQIW
jgi:hypothetical protein